MDTPELIQVAAKTSFDAHHPPSPDLINQCVHCGFCLPACPTYVLWRSEMDSPRGRIYLMKMASEEGAPLSPEWVSHIDTCLGCVACMTACPSGVDYGKLIEATRAQVERLHRRSLAERLHRGLLFRLFPRPERLRWLRPLLAAYQASGLPTFLRTAGILKLLPARMQAMEALAPKLGRRQAIPEVLPAQGTRRLRAGLMLGCVQREFLSEVNAATARTLSAEGCEVVSPASQPCCGALLVHAGEEEQALAFARRMIDVFEQADVDCIVTNAAGCGSVAKDYGYLLRDDAQYAERARRFSAKCRDISEVLDELGPRAARHPLPIRVAFHDSCHLQHAQKVRAQPRALLAAIPGLTLVELPESGICCGSAGIYSLVQPKTANELADRKASLIAPANVDAVATGNPGCLLQLRAALERHGHAIPVLHTIQLVDASIQDRPFTAP
ncbi:MAG: 4Fe-4S dicluster domain-containing protein [Acidobacteriia bacterium]|nr:4Fe-4S dicluster domain-containing protein [Terriglobia bacterium]